MDLIARKDHRTGRTQTLLEHSTHVAAATSASCIAVGFAFTGRLIGLLHDFGKCSTRCQQHLLTEGDRSNPPHAILGARFVIEELCGISHPTDPQPESARIIANDSDTHVMSAVVIASCISFHHIGLADLVSPHGIDDFAAKVFREELAYDYEEARKRFERIVSLAECRNLFEEAVRELEAFQANLESTIDHIDEGFDLSASRLCQFRTAHYGMLIRELASALIDADRKDAYQWSVGLADPPLPDDASRNIDWDSCCKAVEAYSANRYDAYAEQNPALAQARENIACCCTDFAATMLKPGIFRLTADTGSGKTTAVLRMLASYAKRTGTVRRIVYVAPFKAILLQNTAEWTKAVGGTIEILEHHSDVVEEKSADRRLLDHEKQRVSEKPEEDASSRELLVERWSSTLIVTTLVQLLNTLFSNKPTRVRRLQALTDSVIVLDEIQSVPLRFVHLFNTALCFLSSYCNCTVICMSATQPALELTPIPLVLGEPAEIVPRERGFSPCFKRVETIDTSRSRHTIASLARFAEERCSEEGSTLVVANTKRSAVALWTALEERGSVEAFLVTGYQCSVHREKLLSDVKCELEKARQGLRPPLICVSTSLIEAGVDISFSCGIRAIAGIDSIVQMMGRINRNGETELAHLYLVSHEGDETAPSEISNARRAAQRVLHEQANEQSSTSEHAEPSPANKRHDEQGVLLSADALAKYYRYLYACNEGELDYPLKRADDPALEGATLFELFSSNRSDLMKNKPSRRFARQALGTVGRLMKPIENEGASVIVPYGSEGSRIIEQLVAVAQRTNPITAGLYDLVRQAQRYTVNLSKRDLNALGNHVTTIDELGVRYLESECYCDDKGVVFPDYEAIRQQDFADPSQSIDQ